MIIWKDYMHFLISHVFLVHRLSFLSCKVQIILRFKSRLHIQHIVHGFCSIIHWLLFTLFCHISFHRKKIHYPLHQHWWMFSGLYDTGKDGGWTLVHIVSVDATLSGSGGQTKEKTFVLKHTHAYRLHIDHLVSHVFLFFNVGAGPQRADTAVSDKPKALKTHIHIQLSIWWTAAEYCNVCLFCFKGSFQMHCQLSGSTWKCCDCDKTHTHKKIVLKLSRLPASNHSLHRFLSVFTVGHPSNGVDLLVGPSAGERWYF